jgi:flavorubredoxin
MSLTDLIPASSGVPSAPPAAAPAPAPAPAGPPAESARHLPVQIAPDTFVIQATQGEGVAPVAVHLNAMVIRGSEPIIVDTGVPSLGERYLADMWSLVDPEDVRWVFLSHDDIDHHGNLEAVMAACPNATLITTWFMWERMGNLPGIRPWRMRWVADGEAFEANGRTYAAIRPPLYDSPTTRGLLDTGTGVYWASDCFATTVPRGVADVAELDRDEWVDAMIANAHGLSPWVRQVEGREFHRAVDDLGRLDLTAIASCHSPTITGANLAVAREALHAAPTAPLAPMPGQELLDMIIAQALAEVPS